ncbi:MAG: cytochrome c [Planctomycetota bacterium]
MLGARGASVLALALLPACAGEGGVRSKYTLHTVMLQMDYDDKALAQQLGQPDQALGTLESLQRWGTDAAFEAYVARGTFEGDPADFRERQTLFQTRLDAALSAARSGDPAALQAKYFELRMSCELCHAEYRPEPR